MLHFVGKSGIYNIGEELVFTLSNPLLILKEILKRPSISRNNRLAVFTAYVCVFQVSREQCLLLLKVKYSQRFHGSNII